MCVGVFDWSRASRKYSLSNLLPFRLTHLADNTFIGQEFLLQRPGHFVRKLSLEMGAQATSVTQTKDAVASKQPYMCPDKHLYT